MDMIFSIRQLQEKGLEQKQPLNTAFIDLTKAFDMVGRKGHFRLLEKIRYSTKLLKLIAFYMTSREYNLMAHT